MKHRGLFLLVFLSSIHFAADAHALFQLSVSPRTGGQTVRFTAGSGQDAELGNVYQNEEVDLAVTTDEGVQYRILQTVYQPLTNESGQAMPAGALVVFSPSSPLGTLRTQLETPLSLGQSQIYTSNTAGDSDDFILVFNVRIPENQAGGVYRTQLTFTAEPVNAQGGTGPSTTTLDIRVEIQPKFRLDLRGEMGSRALDLGKITKDRPRGTGLLKIEITSSVGASYRIFHQLTEPLVSEQGVPLDEKTLAVSPSGNAQGALSAGLSSPVPTNPSLLYSSGEWGASDILLLEYVLTPDAGPKAGVYRGMLSFRVESQSPFVTQEILHVPVSIEIEPIFSLETRFENAGGLTFGMFKPGQDPDQERIVSLVVRSNLGEPYQISQVIPQTMVTSDGSPMPEGAFRYSVGPARQGSVKISGSVPVKNGEDVLFVSDAEGTPEELQVHYVLEVPRQTKPGSYTSQIKYSMTTL